MSVVSFPQVASFQVDQKTKPLYDFLREKLGIQDVYVSGRLEKIFDVTDEELVAFAKALPTLKNLTTEQVQELLSKITVVEL
ncbi:hypothetical protein A3I18_01940 [Candidatus Campbellbacteria bacterium RIFCSPLOWO2_02_FULL_35_11]|uniref:Uncharacterized protein n=2 Tax=Candidatus Campbelliibacteriota TaxID=1752727 RepID=A0A1F5EMJ6_9BACT|nr:MAG: hypothetical protein A3E89_01880 [Candidatus Campbellbacteria bacterium RIFCSPHIGHO2_12_FULL_35_10]OGD70215.1 MAG: hypothetical protein A3I18_01940 [Candidatus Campbellbacteria bacterium RIFCSPLOWO2_02_FULL_35_11]